MFYWNLRFIVFCNNKKKSCKLAIKEKIQKIKDKIQEYVK